MVVTPSRYSAMEKRTERQRALSLPYYFETQRAAWEEEQREEEKRGVPEGTLWHAPDGQGDFQETLNHSNPISGGRGNKEGG